MSIDNPFHQVYAAIWSLLESDSNFTTAVPSMNRIKYTSTLDRNPDKDGMLNADYVCVRLRSIGMNPRSHRTSNSSMVEALWTLEVFAGDQRFAMPDEKAFFDAEFAIFKALENWQSYLDSFTWESNTFKVRKCRAVKVQTAFGQDEFNRTGWQSVWRGVTDIWFSTNDLLP